MWKQKTGIYSTESDADSDHDEGEVSDAEPGLSMEDDKISLHQTENMIGVIENIFSKIKFQCTQTEYFDAVLKLNDEQREV